MQRLTLSFVALSIGMSAHATPYVLDLQFEGPPEHAHLSDPDLELGRVIDIWEASIPTRPPLGTSSFELSIALPAVYEVQDTGHEVVLDLRCEWGSSFVSPGSQSVPLTSSTFEPDPVAPDEATIRISGPPFSIFNPDSIGYNISAFPAPGTRLQRFHAVVSAEDMAPTPITAGNGTCTLLATVSGDASLPDVAVLSEVVESQTVVDVSDRLATDASTTYEGRLQPATTPGPAVVQQYLEPVMEALVDGGCQTEPTVQNAVAGAFGRAWIEGVDDDGVLTGGTLDRTHRVFGAVLGDGSTGVGSAGGQVSTYAGTKLYAALDDGGFFAGRWRRVAGRNGVFYGVTGVCDGPQDAGTALSGWFGAPLP